MGKAIAALAIILFIGSVLRELGGVSGVIARLGPTAGLLIIGGLVRAFMPNDSNKVAKPAGKPAVSQLPEGKSYPTLETLLVEAVKSDGKDGIAGYSHIQLEARLDAKPGDPKPRRVTIAETQQRLAEMNESIDRFTWGLLPAKGGTATVIRTTRDSGLIKTYARLFTPAAVARASTRDGRPAEPGPVAGAPAGPRR